MKASTCIVLEPIPFAGRVEAYASGYLNAGPLSTRRILVIWTLVVLAALTTLGASLAIWTKRQLLDSGEWTKSSSQLLADQNVRDVVSQRLVSLISQRTDLEKQINRALPKKAKGVAPIAAVALEGVSERSINAFLGTAQAQGIWRQANRRAHSELVRVLEGKSVGPIETSKGGVFLDLGPLATKVARTLGIDRQLKTSSLPRQGKILLVRSNELDTAQTAVRVIRLLSVWLVVLALILFAIALYLAPGQRRRWLEICGVSVAVVGFVLLIVRRMVGDAVIDNYVSTEAYRPAIRSAWLIETRLLVNLAIALIAYGALAVAVAYLGGQSRVARAIRHFLLPVFRQRRAVFHTGLLFLFLAVLAWGPTTGTQRLFGLAVLTGLIAIGIELWRRQALAEYRAEAEAQAKGTKARKRSAQS